MRSRFAEFAVITRCHNYVIQTKFVYLCAQCGYRYNRHSRSIDTRTQFCGLCRGQLVLNVRVPHSRTPPNENTQPPPTAPPGADTKKGSTAALENPGSASASGTGAVGGLPLRMRGRAAPPPAGDDLRRYSLVRRPSCANPFASFVKANFATVKAAHTDWKHGQIMREIAAQFKLVKAK